jgi:hypothetical protein
VTARARPRRSAAPAALALAGALAACAHGSAEKGGLVPLDVAPRALEAAHAPRRVALVVGIQGFDDASWRPLRFPNADAEALGAVLADPAKGAFDEVDVVRGATRAGLRDALARLAARDRDERDTVVVYVSSHGTLARDATGALRRYLVARDTRMADVPGTALSMDELQADFDRLRSRRKVLVLATCHSGAGKSLLPPGVADELARTKAGFFVRPIEEVSKASVVLAASDWGETATEDEKLGNDVYTHFLVEALRIGADRNGDGAVTASEAHDYARRMTYAYTGGRQRPSAETSEVGADPIVLVGKVERRGSPELYGYAPWLDGFTVSVDGRPVAELPGGLALDPGRHRVVVAKGDGAALVDASLSLGAGDRVAVEDLVRRGESQWEVAPAVAVLGFLDARSRTDVLPPVPGFGATLAWRGWAARGLELRLDVIGSAGKADQPTGAGPAPFRFSAFTAGVSLPWRFTPSGLGGAALLAGPRLSAVWIRRSFELDASGAPQSFLTVTPGLLAGATVPLGRGFVATAELHLDWMLVRLDGASRSTGFGEALLGAGWRF